jgi:hypothetical protein
MNAGCDLAPSGLTPRRRAALLRHGLTVLEAQRQMNEDGGGPILRRMLAGAPQHQAMQHYPPGDRIDAATGAQYFYHAHRENRATGEHGHFHCFLRRHGMPARLRPQRPAAAAAMDDGALTHLVAIAMDRHSRPVRLFTVNRWVTEDHWYAARHQPRLLRSFRFATPAADPAWAPLDRWVAGMLQLFAPEIAGLAQARDRALTARQAAQPDRRADADRQIEELSSLPIDLERHLTGLALAN